MASITAPTTPTTPTAQARAAKTKRRRTRISLASRPWKFEPPRLAERLLPRERLIAQIEQVLGRNRSSGDVLLVSAPAGYGKSTALAQWALHTKRPVAWYHLDATDNDPVLLIRGIVRALRLHLLRTQWDVLTLLKQSPAGALSPQDIQRAAMVLGRNIQQNVIKPLTLILTGVSEIKAKSPTALVLDTLLGRSTDCLRIVLEAREPPHLRLSPLVAAHRLEGIGIDDLRLTEEEFQGLLQLVDVPAQPEVIDSLRSLCNGWVTGVLLATDALLPPSLSGGWRGEIDHQEVFDYLAGEVIDALHPTLRDFATDVAVCEYLTVPLCNTFLERTDAREMLVALERRTGFVTRMGRRPDEPVYRIHPLLRQALLARLEAAPNGHGYKATLSERAGLAFEALGDDEEAIRHYIEATCFERAVALIESRQGILLRAGCGATLTRWLDLLPELVRENHPQLQILLADLYRQAGNMEDARREIERVCAVLSQPSHHAHQEDLLPRALVARASVLYSQGDYLSALRDAQTAGCIAPPDADEIHIQAGFILAAATKVLSGPEAADTYLASIEERASRQHNLWALARLNYMRSSLALAQGRYRQAEGLASLALHTAQEANDEIDAINSRINLATAKQCLGRSREARGDLEAAGSQAELAGYTLGYIYALTNLGDVELSTKQYARACEVYEQARLALEDMDDRYLRGCTYAAFGVALALAGRATEALEVINSALASHMYADISAEWRMLISAQGLAHLLLGQFAEAENALSKALAASEEQCAVAEIVRVQIFLAALRLAQGNEKAAVELLSEAMERADHVEEAPALLLEIKHFPHLWPLLRHLKQHLYPLADALLSQLETEASAATSTTEATEAVPSLMGDRAAAENSPKAVSIFLLGSAQILVGTERITRWRYRAACDLLLFLADQRAPVHKNTILNALWGEKTDQEADKIFGLARYYLKETLGQPCLVKRNDCWHLTLDYQVDAHAFEQLVDEGEALARDNRISQALDTLRKARTYWRGPYLEGYQADWARPRRSQLQDRYLACLELLAELEAFQSHFDVAAQSYQQILEIEPYRETAHRGLMRYFLSRGNYAEAIRQYNHCVSVLANELHIPPSPETLALCQEITEKMSRGVQAFAATRR